MVLSHPLRPTGDTVVLARAVVGGVGKERKRKKQMEQQLGSYLASIRKERRSEMTRRRGYIKVPQGLPISQGKNSKSEAAYPGE